MAHTIRRAVCLAFSVVVLVSLGISAPALAQTPRCAKAGTQAGIWTPDECGVYAITGSVLVAAGTTLEIRSGTQVRFADPTTELVVEGTLVVRGTSGARIRFSSDTAVPQQGDWGRIYFRPSAVGATFDGSSGYQSGSIIEYADIEYAGSRSTSLGLAAITVEGAAPFLGNNRLRFNRTTAIQLNPAPAGEQPARLSNNEIRDNGTANSGLTTYGLYSQRSTIAVGNTVADTIGNGMWFAQSGPLTITVTLDSNLIAGNDGIGAFVAGLEIIAGRISRARISNNRFLHNTGDGWAGGCRGGGLRIRADATVTGNLFADNGRNSGNAVCVDSGAGVVTITNNDLYSTACSNVPVVHNATSRELDARDNYWNTTNTNRVRELIYDFEDQPTTPTRLGIVRFDPLRATPVTDYKTASACVYLPLVRR